MKKILLLLSALLIIGSTTNCSRKGYSQREGLMLTDKYNQPRNKKKSKQSKKKYKQRQKIYKKKRR